MRFGKDPIFFELLIKQAEVANKSAVEFLALVNDFANLGVHADRLAELESEGDELTHELQRKVVATFITPVDKEDLTGMSQALDDVTDLIEAVAARAKLYKLSAPRGDLQPIAQILVKATQTVVEAVTEFRTGYHSSPSLLMKLEDIHSVENEGDKLFREALGRLFNEPGADALNVIKWKEIYDRVETAVDKCEDISSILETVMVKYA